MGHPPPAGVLSALCRFAAEQIARVPLEGPGQGLVPAAAGACLHAVAVTTKCAQARLSPCTHHDCSQVILSASHGRLYPVDAIADSGIHLPLPLFFPRAVGALTVGCWWRPRLRRSPQRLLRTRLPPSPRSSTLSAVSADPRRRRTGSSRWCGAPHPRALPWADKIPKFE